MNAREILEAEEMKRHFIALYPICAVCHGGPSTQLAHRIGQGKHNLKRYGRAVIHHHLNMVPVCGLKCNSAVVIDHKPMQVKALLTAIHFDIDGDHQGAIDLLGSFDFVAEHVFDLGREVIT
jgi:hypothetical protein